MSAIVHPSDALLEAAQAVLLEELATGRRKIPAGQTLESAARNLRDRASAYLKDDPALRDGNEVLYEKVLRVMMNDRSGSLGTSDVQRDDLVWQDRGRIGSMGY